MPSQVADILMREAAAAARAREASGAIWGQTVSNLGQLPGQVLEQNRLEKERQLRQQELQLRQQESQQNLALGAERLRGLQEQRQDILTTDQVLSDPSNYNSDGTLNRAALRGKIASHPNAGHLLPKFNEFADHLEETAATLAQKQQALAESQRETLGKDALQIEAAGNDPGFAQLAITHRSSPGPNGEAPIIPKAQADSWMHLATTPAGVASLVKTWKAGSQAGVLKIVNVPEGATPLDERTGQPLAGFTPTQKPKDEWNTFQDTYAKQAGGPTAKWQDLSPTQQAQGFVAFTKMKADPAAERLASSQAAAVASQNRTQNFANLERARAAVEKDVNQPYANAQSSAEELRNLVRSAQAGNKVAASMQSLQAAASIIRANGLNRINMAEIAMPATAGSIVDRFLNLAGKVTTGQPVDAALQKDMLAVADVMERGAYQKAIKAHRSIQKLYEVPQLQPTIEAPASVTTTDTSGGGGGGPLTYADYLKRKGK